MTLSGGVWQTGNAHATGVTFGTWIPPASVAYLAIMSAAGPVCRDVLLALFWPDRNDEEARRALRQALYHLRRAVGDDVIVGAGDELSKDGLRKRSSFYRGDFFDGFHVEEVTSELDEWIDRTRTRLKRRA
jgi:serine/threonine-protein kinase